MALQRGRHKRKDALPIAGVDADLPPEHPLPVPLQIHRLGAGGFGRKV